MKGSKSLIAITIAATLAITPSAIAAPKTTLKAAGRVITTVVNTILSGAGIPTKAIGIDGDFYIDTKNANLYGPKTKGVWKILTSLKQNETKSVTTVIGEQGGMGATGAQGDKGDKGATGNTGAVGSAGSMGATGAAGAKGNEGATGATGLSGATGSIGVTGATGPTGPAGVQGVKGDTGLTGPAGSQGAKGDTGLTGTQGVKGETGTVGTQGVKGDAGTTGAAGISVTKFASVPSISLVTATDGISNSGIFFVADSDGNYTFDILVAGGVQTNVDYKLNAEIVIGTTAIIAQYVVASDAITFANGSPGRQYGFHIIGAAASVAAGTSFGLRISIQYGAGTSTVFFTGRALINKVGSIG
jgi:hypothetical protein